jgi:hypothetical protein
MASRYSTNFTQGVKNELQVGRDLEIHVDGNPVYIIGQLFKKKSFFRKNLIQIEQTGSKQNPQKNHIVFEMKVPGGQPMEPGKYHVVTYAYFQGLGGKRWKDDFEII